MDPYNDDDNSENGDAAGDLLNAGEKPNFFKAVNVIGSTIRDGGFCKPRKEVEKRATRELNIKEFPMSDGSDTTPPETSESDDSNHGKSRSVTFTAVEPLIIEDDLVFEEESPATVRSIELSLDTRTPTRNTMLPPAFIIFTSILSVALAFFYPQSMEPIIALVKDNIPMGLGTAISLAITIGVSIAPTKNIAVASELSWCALVSIMMSSTVYQLLHH